MAEGGAVGGDEVVAGSGEDTAGKSGAPVVAAGKESVSGGGADGAGCVGVEEGDTLVGHLLEMRSLDLTIGIGGRDVADTEVVGHHDDDVWLGGKEAEGGTEKSEGEEFHEMIF